MTRVVKITFTDWLQGEDSSALLRSSDERKCCLGFYEEAIGVPRALLLDTAVPARYRDSDLPLPAEGDWLVELDQFGEKVSSVDCMALVNYNDLLFLPGSVDCRALGATGDEDSLDYFTFLLLKMREISTIFARHAVRIEWLLA